MVTATSGDIANVIHINSRSHNDPQSMFILITIQAPGASILITEKFTSSYSNRQWSL